MRRGGCLSVVRKSASPPCLPRQCVCVCLMNLWLLLHDGTNTAFPRMASVRSRSRIKSSFILDIASTNPLLVRTTFSPALQTYRGNTKKIMCDSGTTEQRVLLHILVLCLEHATNHELMNTKRKRARVFVAPRALLIYFVVARFGCHINPRVLLFRRERHARPEKKPC